MRQGLKWPFSDPRPIYVCKPKVSRHIKFILSLTSKISLEVKREGNDFHTKRFREFRQTPGRAAIFFLFERGFFKRVKRVRDFRHRSML